ncbi:MAG: bifunctional heptose 7-phosphate kinase/heptose 1-phosphate adenyltransferase, partial [Clostridia bacterium]|nr:bifunctional heptose 7-phosphate kinase/heptose 1-phosphate adenyltransferase [Clostridia bacterium]
LTRGEEGMTLFEAGRPPLHIPVLAPSDVFDVTGAGDTVTAALTLALAAGASFPTAAVLANAAAGVAVTKPGAATVNREEVTAALRRWRPSLLAVAAEDWRGAGTGWG